MFSYLSSLVITPRTLFTQLATDKTFPSLVENLISPVENLRRSRFWARREEIMAMENSATALCTSLPPVFM